MPWKSKKQEVVAHAQALRPSTGVTGQWLLPLGICELIWVKHLLSELEFCKLGPLKLVCDNQAAIHIQPTQFFMKELNI